MSRAKQLCGRSLWHSRNKSSALRPFALYRVHHTAWRSRNNPSSVNLQSTALQRHNAPIIEASELLSWRTREAEAAPVRPALAAFPGPPRWLLMKAERLRVLFCHDNMNIGGTELNAVRIAERVDRERFDVAVACFRTDGPLASRYAAAGIPVERFDVRSLAGPTALTQGVRLARLLAKRRVHVVHSHDRYWNMFATPWARLVRTPAVIASKRWLSFSRAHAVGHALAYRLAHRVVANSEFIATSLEAEDRVPGDRVVVVPNFVDDDAFVTPAASWRERVRNKLLIPPEARIVGMVANLRWEKDHPTLMDAFAAIRPSYPDVHLVLVGSGDMETQLRQRAADLNIEPSVRFAGTMSNSPNVHSLFDISVLSSSSEGFPNTVIEAMAAARPVIATRVGGIPDGVIHSETGLLVPPRDPSALAEAIGQLLADPARGNALGAAGRRRAQSRFSAASVVPAIESLYEGLVRESA